MNEAIKGMNEKEFEGRKITIHQFLPRDQRETQKFNKETKSYRATVEEKEEEKVKEEEMEEIKEEEEKEEKEEEQK